MSSPLSDVDGRRARLAQRIPQIAPSAVHEYLALTTQCLDLDHEDVERDPLAHLPAPGDARWVHLEPGQAWGRSSELVLWGFPAHGGEVTWLRSRVDVPVGWADDDVLLGLDDLHLGTDHGAAHAVALEALVYLDGAVHAGLDDHHRAVLLPRDAAGRGYDVAIRVTTAARRTFAGLRLLRRHRDTWRLGVLANTLLGVAKALGPDDVVTVRIRQALDDLYRTLDLNAGGWNSAALRRSATGALPRLESFAEGLSRAVPPAGHEDRPLVVATGHAHLDVAWLWPVWRTRQKVAHTVATALNLMDHYPDYHFSLSAPQTWQFIAQDDPELFSRMLSRVSEGRLEPVGVFWLESDGTLPSGESLVRQVRHGCRFYAEHLGPQQVPTAAWLPDSFGFTAALPTILAACGVHMLLTTKLSWNRTNRMPADTFTWRGPDGSSVLAHFVTATAHPATHPADPVAHTYAGDASPAEVVGLWRDYRDKEVSSRLLYLYGHGDGGGGPTEEMVAALDVMADLPHLPRVRPGQAADLFADLLAEAADHPRLATWTGDLYLEAHRGTLTSQQRTKRGNRDGELALREAEWVNALAVLHGAPDRQGDLDVMWETLLRNQFHDILPGSGIPRVPADAAVEHAEVVAAAIALRDAALGAPDTDGGPRVVVNGLSWPRSGVIATPDGALVHVTDVPGFAVAALPDVSTLDPPEPARAVRRPDGGVLLTNGALRAVLDANGEIVSLTDGAGVETVGAGERANRLIVYEDRPLSWDAWDIDPFYPDKATALIEADSVEPFAEGPLRAGVRVTRRTAASTVVQTLTLDAGGRRLDVVTEVDWHERNRLLRVLFGLAANARHALLGRQFGSVEVPVHRNTSWEQARFEVAAHGWCDIADAGGGLALLTDAIYGHSIAQACPAPGLRFGTRSAGTVLGLSLLKSGSWPNPTADAGRHRLRYALMPHAGGWQSGHAHSVVAEAMSLAVPLRWLDSTRRTGGLLCTDSPHVVVETVKTAWDGDGIVLRLYEAHNRAGPVRLILDRPARSAHRCDALERDSEPLPLDGPSPDASTLTLDLAAHELVTVRLRY